jgi:hypothetical protein
MEGRRSRGHPVHTLDCTLPSRSSRSRSTPPMASLFDTDPLEGLDGPSDPPDSGDDATQAQAPEPPPPSEGTPPEPEPASSSPSQTQAQGGGGRSSPGSLFDSDPLADLDLDYGDEVGGSGNLSRFGARLRSSVGQVGERLSHSTSQARESIGTATAQARGSIGAAAANVSGKATELASDWEAKGDDDLRGVTVKGLKSATSVTRLGLRRAKKVPTSAALPPPLPRSDARSVAWPG